MAKSKTKRQRGQRTKGAKANTADLAKNYEELANALGVTRMQLYNWRRNKSYKGHPKPDGMQRHSISAWKAFVAKHGLGEKPEEVPERITLENEERRLRIEQRRLKVEKEAGVLIPRAVVAVKWADNINRFVASVRRAMENEIPPMLPLSPVEQMEAKRKISEKLDKVIREAKGRSL